MAGLIIGEPQGLPLHLPCFLECRLVVHLLAAPQVDISDLPAFLVLFAFSICELFTPPLYGFRKHKNKDVE